MPLHREETIPVSQQGTGGGEALPAVQPLPLARHDVDRPSLATAYCQRVEMLVATLSATCRKTPVQEIESSIAASLRQVVEALACDCGMLAEFSGAPATLRVHSWWGVPEVAAPPMSEASLSTAFPWYARQLQQGNMVCWSRLDEVPAEASAETQHWQSLGLQSLLAIPFTVAGGVVYMLSLATFHAPYSWSEALLGRLRLLGELFVQVLLRQRSHEQLEQHRQFETLLAEISAVCAKVPANDVDQAINDGLRRVVEYLGIERSTLLEFSADQTELYVIHSYAVPGIPPHIRAHAVQHELPWYTSTLRRGEIVRFRRLDELPEEALCEKQLGKRVGIKSCLLIPVAMSGAPLWVIGFGAFRTEVDWPAEWIPRLRLLGELFANALMRKRAEEALRRLWHELAHGARVAMLGELTASLAHELNQPLAAILSNAQAAQRFLARETPALVEVQEALTDIVADNRRAGQLIQQLCRLGSPPALERVPLNMNTLVQQVVQLVWSEAIEHQVKLTLELVPVLPVVYGDRLQLQQVLLNLMLNAFEAMRQTTDQRRELVVRTAYQDAAVTVALQDTGRGVDETTLQRMFTAFFTTKAKGMGLGLAVSRSIIAAHGGRLWALPNTDQGITVCLTLPLGKEATA
jgi:signal transduction histidine kinase